MKTLKGWITTTCMLAMLMVSTTAVKADGVIIAGVSAPTSCTTETVQKVKGTDFGVIIAGLTGVICYHRWFYWSNYRRSHESTDSKLRRDNRGLRAI
jgi:hypothetical protein